MSISITVLQTTVAAIVGYITNALAIEMIFEKKCGVGGLILETRHEFSRNIGELVERDLVTGEGIAQEMEREAFRQAFATFLGDLITRDLYQLTVDQHLGSMPGYDSTAANGLEFINRHKDTYISHILHVLGKQVTVDKLLSPRQRLHGAAWTVKTGHDIIASSDVVEGLVHMLYQEWQQKRLCDLASPLFFRQIGQGLEASLTGTTLLLQPYRQGILAISRTAYQELDVTTALQQAQYKLSSKSLADLLGLDKAGNLNSQLLDRAIHYLCSTNGNPVLDKIAGALLGATRQSGKNLFELLPADAATKLEAFIQREIPTLLNNLLALLRNSESELNRIIDRTTETTLEKRGGLRAKVALSLKRFFNRKVNFASQLIAKAEAIDPNSVSSVLTEQLIVYLKKNTVGQIVTQLEQRRIISSDLLIKFMVQSLSGIGTTWSASLNDEWIRRPLGLILPPNAYLYADNYLRQQGLSAAVDKALSTPALDKIMAKQAQDWLDTTIHKPLSALIAFDDLNRLLPILKTHLLSSDTAKLAETLVRLSTKWLPDNANLMSVLTAQNQELIRQALSSRVSQQFVRHSEQWRELSIHRLYFNLGLLDRNYDNLADTIRKELTHDLDILLKGQVSRIVTTAMDNQDTNTFKQRVKEFMGKELQPISLFGALLGGLVGLCFAALEIAPSWGNLGWTALMYAIVGILTNVIAVWMIFHPYKPITFCGKTLWLTPGAIAKNQASFASNMGHFIGSELLSADKIQQTWKEKAASAEQTLAQHMSAGNYNLITALAERSRPAVTDWAAPAALQWLKKSPQAAEPLVKHLALSLSSFNPDSLAAKEPVLSSALTTTVNAELAPFVTNLKTSSQSIADCLGTKQNTQAINAIGDYIANHLLAMTKAWLNDPASWQQLINTFAHEADSVLDETINASINPETRQQIYNSLWQQLLSQLEYSGQIRKYLGEVAAGITAEFRADRQVKEIFGGQLMNLIYSNLDVLITNLSSQLQQYASAQRQVWANEAYDDLNFLESLLVNRSTIEEIVNNLVDRELPQFLASRETELQQLVRHFAETSLACQPISHTGLVLDTTKLNHALSGIIENPDTRERLRQALYQVFNWLGDIPLRNITTLVGINRLTDAASVLSEELEVIRSHLSANSNKLDKLASPVASIITGVSYELTKHRTAANLLQAVDSSLLEKVSSGLVAQLAASDAWHLNFREFLLAFDERIQQTALFDVLSFNYAVDDFHNGLAWLSDNTAIQEEVQSLVRQALHDLYTYREPLVAESSKQYLTELAARTVCQALPRHLPALLSGMDLQGLAEREIMRMDPAQIEVMFDSFAKKYLNKLKLYGVIGAAGVGFDALLLLFLKK